MARKTKDKKVKTPSCIVELPLGVSLKDEHFILASFHSSTSLYNAALGESLKRLEKLKRSPEWIHARTIKNPDLKREAFKAAVKQYKFTSDSISSFTTACKNEGKMNDRIGADICQKIAQRAFASVNDFCYGKKGKPRFKGIKRQLHSIEGQTNNTKTGIRYRPESDCVEYHDLNLRVLFPKVIPIEKVDRETGEITQYSVLKNTYLETMLSYKTKYCRLVWRRLNGKQCWFVQLIRQGTPPTQKNTTIPAEAQGQVIGLDMGPSTVAIVGNEIAELKTFCNTIQDFEKEIKRIQRAMDRSKRATNPQCFNPNGTWKKGSQFIPSQNYLALKNQLAELNRRMAAERKRSHGELINTIVRHGTIVQTEKLSYQGWQKGLFGKSIGKRAPGMFVQLLRRKAERAGGAMVDLDPWGLKLSQYDHTTQDYIKKPLKLRTHVLRDGSGTVQRDLYSAFLAYCVRNQKLLSSLVCKNWESRKHALLAERSEVQSAKDDPAACNGIGEYAGPDLAALERIANKDVLVTATAPSKHGKAETPLHLISKIQLIYGLVV